MEISGKMNIIGIALLCLFTVCSGAPLHNSLLFPEVHAIASDHFLVFLSVGFFLVCALALFGCTCWSRKNVESLGDQNSVQQLSGNSGSQLQNQSEFAIFPPCSSVINLQPVHSSLFGKGEDKVIFEPLPDILPKRHVNGQNLAQSSKPAHFSALLKKKSSLHDWFDDPSNNFPRNHLQYLQEIGNGWFGKVVEGEAQMIYPRAGKTAVIVKILREEATPSEHLYFLHEVRPYRDLQHQNIVRLLGRCLETDPFLLIMEHTSTDLKSYLIKHQDELIKQDMTGNLCLLKMATDITAGLSHMHENNLVHSDLAAHNCFVGLDCSFKVGDYGISFDKFREDYYCVEEIALPIRWYSPEALHCSDTTIETHEVTKEANIWSLGVTLWEVVELGKLPYPTLTNEEVLRKVIVERIATPNEPQSRGLYNKQMYAIMQLCWKAPHVRPKVQEILSLLHQVPEEKDSSQSFDHRWNALHSKENSLPHAVALKFENDFVENSSLHSSCGLTSECNFESLAFEVFGNDSLHENEDSYRSPSLRALNGSFDEIISCESLQVHSQPNLIVSSTYAGNSDDKSLSNSVKDIFSQRVEMEVTPEQISEALHNLDAVLASEALVLDVDSQTNSLEVINDAEVKNPLECENSPKRNPNESLKNSISSDVEICLGSPENIANNSVTFLDVGNAVEFDDVNSVHSKNSLLCSKPENSNLKPAEEHVYTETGYSTAPATQTDHAMLKNLLPSNFPPCVEEVSHGSAISCNYEGPQTKYFDFSGTHLNEASVLHVENCVSRDDKCCDQAAIFQQPLNNSKLSQELIANDFSGNSYEECKFVPSEKSISEDNISCPMTSTPNKSCVNFSFSNGGLDISIDNSCKEYQEHCLGHSECNLSVAESLKPELNNCCQVKTSISDVSTETEYYSSESVSGINETGNNCQFAIVDRNEDCSSTASTSTDENFKTALSVKSSDPTLLSPENISSISEHNLLSLNSNTVNTDNSFEWNGELELENVPSNLKNINGYVTNEDNVKIGDELLLSHKNVEVDDYYCISNTLNLNEQHISPETCSSENYAKTVEVTTRDSVVTCVKSISSSPDRDQCNDLCPTFPQHIYASGNVTGNGIHSFSSVLEDMNLSSVGEAPVSEVVVSDVLKKESTWRCGDSDSVIGSRQDPPPAASVQVANDENGDLNSSISVEPIASSQSHAKNSEDDINFLIVGETSISEVIVPDSFKKEDTWRCGESENVIGNRQSPPDAFVQVTSNEFRNSSICFQPTASVQSGSQNSKALIFTEPASTNSQEVSKKVGVCNNFVADVQISHPVEFDEKFRNVHESYVSDDLYCDQIHLDSAHNSALCDHHQQMNLENEETSEKVDIMDQEDYESQLENEEVLKIDIETNEAILVDTSESLIGFVPSRSIELLHDCECLVSQFGSTQDLEENNHDLSLQHSLVLKDKLGSQFFSFEHETDTVKTNGYNAEDVISQPEYKTLSNAENSILFDSPSWDQINSTCNTAVNDEPSPENENYHSVDNEVINLAGNRKPKWYENYNSSNDETTNLNDVENSYDLYNDVIFSSQPTKSVIWHSDETLDVLDDHDKPNILRSVIIEGKEILAGHSSHFIKGLCNLNDNIPSSEYGSSDFLDQLAVSASPSSNCSVASTPCRDVVYTPDFESESAESSSSCSSTSGSFECIHNKFKNVGDIANSSGTKEDTPPFHSSEVCSPLRVFSKSWDCHATPNKGLLKSPEKQMEPVRKSVSFHEDPQLVFQYPPASDSSEEDYAGDDDVHPWSVDYTNYADWELHASEEDEIPEMIEIEELEYEPYNRSVGYRGISMHPLSGSSLYTLTGFSEEDIESSLPDSFESPQWCSLTDFSGKSSIVELDTKSDKNNEAVIIEKFSSESLNMSEDAGNVNVPSNPDAVISDTLELLQEHQSPQFADMENQTFSEIPCDVRDKLSGTSVSNAVSPDFEDVDSSAHSLLDTYPVSQSENSCGFQHPECVENSDKRQTFSEIPCDVRDKLSETSVSNAASPDFEDVDSSAHSLLDTYPVSQSGYLAKLENWKSCGFQHPECVENSDKRQTEIFISEIKEHQSVETESMKSNVFFGAAENQKHTAKDYFSIEFAGEKIKNTVSAAEFALNSCVDSPLNTCPPLKETDNSHVLDNNETTEADDCSHQSDSIDIEADSSSSAFSYVPGDGDLCFEYSSSVAENNDLANMYECSNSKNEDIMEAGNGNFAENFCEAANLTSSKSEVLINNEERKELIEKTDMSARGFIRDESFNITQLDSETIISHDFKLTEVEGVTKNPITQDGGESEPCEPVCSSSNMLEEDLNFEPDIANHVVPEIIITEASDFGSDSELDKFLNDHLSFYESETADEVDSNDFSVTPNFSEKPFDFCDKNSFAIHTEIDQTFNRHCHIKGLDKESQENICNENANTNDMELNCNDVTFQKNTSQSLESSSLTSLPDFSVQKS